MLRKAVPEEVGRTASIPLVLIAPAFASDRIQEWGLTNSTLVAAKVSCAIKRHRDHEQTNTAPTLLPFLAVDFGSALWSDAFFFSNLQAEDYVDGAVIGFVTCELVQRWLDLPVGSLI